MKKILFLTAITAMMTFAASCGQKADSLKIKTISVEDFISHPMAKATDISIS